MEKSSFFFSDKRSKEERDREKKAKSLLPKEMEMGILKFIKENPKGVFSDINSKTSSKKEKVHDRNISKEPVKGELSDSPRGSYEMEDVIEKTKEQKRMNSAQYESDVVEDLLHQKIADEVTALTEGKDYVEKEAEISTCYEKVESIEAALQKIREEIISLQTLQSTEDENTPEESKDNIVKELEKALIKEGDLRGEKGELQKEVKKLEIFLNNKIADIRRMEDGKNSHLN